MKHYLSLLLLLFSFSFVYGNDEIKVKELKSSELYPIYNPLLIDSTDVSKKEYSEKVLLQTFINLDLIKESKSMLTSDEEGVFNLPYAPYDSSLPSQDKAMHLMSFNVDADRYCKAELLIKATDRLEVYVNGKKEKAKESKEDSLLKAKSVKFDLTLEPQRYNVIIKRLAQVHKSDEAAMSVSLTPAKKDSLAVITVSTEGKRRITINDILEGERLGSTSISSTGKYFTVSTRLVEPGGKYTTEMEIRELKTNKTICRFPSSVMVRWLNKEDKFLFSKDKKTDIYLFDPATLSEEKIAEGLSFDYYALSPDNKSLILVLADEIPADKGDLKRTLAPSDRSGGFRKRNSLYLYDIKSQVSRRLTYGHSDLHLNDISPDSKKLLLTISEDIIGRPFSETSLCELDLASMTLDTLLVDKFISSGKYSPDGKTLVISGSGEAFDGIGLKINEGQISNLYDSQAFFFDIKTKEVTPFTKDFDPNISNIQWSANDNKLYLNVEEKDCNNVYTYDVKTKSFRLLPLLEKSLSTIQLSQTSNQALVRCQDASSSYRLYAFDLKSEKLRLLADPYKEQLDELELVKVEDWSFTASNGNHIEGRYYYPYGYEEGKKYPMIVYYYGGTSPTNRVFESTYPLHTYAALGYVVLTLNPSGTTGYGQEFAARHVNAWGLMTADDIIDGTKLFCKEHDFVNEDKIGCIGASYGGFMTQYLLTRTDIFAAGISHAGISNIASYWGEGYWGFGYSAAASANSYPWNNPELYTEQSPLFSADKINTPLLLLHGSVDTNVPIGESIQMFNALRLLGKEVEFITVEGENHAIYGYSKRIQWNKTIHAWFAKWLKDQPEWWNTLYPER